MKRKGITPVIAVVLLLLITVGAVASAWGLYTNITSDRSAIEDLNRQQQARQSQIKVQSVYRWNDGGTDKINVSLRNTGQYPVNLTSDVQLKVDPDGTSEYLPQNLWSGNPDLSSVSLSNTCFGGSGEVLTTEGANKEIECATNVGFPEPGQTIGFQLEYRNVESKSWEWKCQPSSSTDTLCGGN